MWASNVFMGCFIMNLHQASVNLQLYFYQVFIHLFTSGFVILISCMSQTKINGIISIAENKDAREEVT